MEKLFNYKGKVRYFDISTGTDKLGMSQLNSFLAEIEEKGFNYYTQLDNVNKVVMVLWNDKN